MASPPYPLPREIRQSNLLVGNGTAGPYGPTTFKVFNTVDVVVLRKTASEKVFSVVSGMTVTKTASLPLDTVSVTFPGAVVSSTQFVIMSKRLHERLVSTAPGGVVSGDLLEKELSQQGSILQELRRDVDNSIRLAPGATGPKEMATVAEGHFYKTDASGNLIDGGDADDIINAEAAAAQAVAAAAAAAAALASLTMGITARTTAYVIPASDAGKVNAANLTGGNFAFTLPAAADAVNKGIYWVRKSDESKNRLTVQTVNNEEIGNRGPSFSINDVTNEAGLIGIYALDERLSRNFTTGQTVIVAGSVVANANGLWTITRKQVGGNNIMILNGSTFAGVGGPGGTMTLFQRSVQLRIQDDMAGFISDGTRWYIVVGPPYLLHTRDWMLGRNVDYDGFGQNPGIPVAQDFVWDSSTMRIWTRTVFITEVADTPEVGFRRAEVDVAGGSTYPDGPNFVRMPAGGTIAMLHATSFQGTGFEARSVQIHFKAEQNAAPGELGGYGVLAASPLNTAAGCLDVFYWQEDGSVAVKTVDKTGLFNIVQGSNNRRSVWLRNTNASLGVPMMHMLTAATSGHAFITCEGPSSNIKFAVNANGEVLSDAGTAMTSPADVAEHFREWWDGNPKGERRAGKSVVLVDRANPDKIIRPGHRHNAKDTYIRLAETMPRRPKNPNKPWDAVWGVVSVDPALKGRSYWSYWRGMYERDEFGVALTEEVEFIRWTERQPSTTEPLWKGKARRLIGEQEVIITNERGEEEVVTSWQETPHGYFVDQLPDGIVIPDNAERSMEPRKVVSKDYDPTRPYVPREKRQEWAYVGVLGQLPLFKDQYFNSRWFKEGDLSDGLEEWHVR